MERFMSSNFCVAIHGLVYLYHSRSTVSSEELAKHICTNPARVRKVMLMLKKQGLVQTREGKDGGYSCAARAEEITLRHIAEATEFVQERAVPDWRKVPQRLPIWQRSIWTV